MAAMPKGLPFEVGDVAAELGDERVVAGLLAEYCDYLADQLVSLKEAAMCRRSEEVHRIAHAICGGALTIGAADLASAAKNLEKVSEISTSRWAPDLISRIEETTWQLLHDARRRGYGP